jgi:hypothetical protein
MPGNLKLNHTFYSHFVMAMSFFLPILYHVTKESCDSIIFVLMISVRSDDLTFGMTLFVAETELSIDPPGGQAPRPSSVPLVPLSHPLTLHPQQSLLLYALIRR